MKRIVHIIPVGHTKQTLIEGMRQFPFHKAVLVLGKEAGPGERQAEAVAEEIEKELGGLAEVERMHVDMDDIYSAARDIAARIKAEEKAGNQVMVNISGSLRSVGIACYLACAVTGAELYMALPSYEDGRVTGIRRVIKIPLFPIKTVGREEESILLYLFEKGPVDSMDRLILGLYGKDKDSPGYLNERARMSYHIKKLREKGFIDTDRHGKSLRISLSKMGEVYSAGHRAAK
ncbi:MAG: hypothetical protein D6733_05175 [Methanobacteriota archaeon]|nr:MAG: hypothetical protein D6733_05175 [Euryarchaeota archaeon]